MADQERGEDPRIARLAHPASGVVARRLGRNSRPPRLAPRLVALHGGPGLDHAVLLPLAHRLAEQYEVWLPDLPGHGESVTPSGRAPGRRALEDRLAVWLRSSSRPIDVVLGHSLGAWLGCELVRRRRVSPRALVLVSPPGAGQPGSGSAVDRAAALVEAAVDDSIATVPAAEQRDARRELARHLEAETRGRATKEFSAALARMQVRPPWRYRSLLRNIHKGLTKPLRPFDPGCPCLVLCGEDDLTTPPAQAERVASALRGARLSILPGVGHYPFAEEPAATAAAIAEFLAEALAQRRSQTK